jgi:hypothetical protein
MIFLNIIANFDDGISQLVLAIGGLVLFIYIIFSRRFLSKKKYGKAIYQQDNAVVEKDVLGMDKAVIEDTDTSYANIGNDKSIKVKTILLIILIIIGLYLVVFYR